MGDARDVRKSPRIKPRAAHLWFFPAAAGYGALILPLSLYAMLAPGAGPRLLGSGLGHAHEMLFGYALAVVAGYLLGPLPPRRLGILLGLWLLARVAFLAVPGWAAAAANAVFAVALAGQVAPKFLGAAKKLRNQAFAPILIAFCVTAALTAAAIELNRVGLGRGLLLEAVLLVSTLMLFMGGRIIAPAAAGQRTRQRENLAARVQPRIEAGLLLTMAAAVVLAAVAPARGLAGTALVLAGILAAVRLLRWQLWRCRGRPDLLCLGIGYAWLAVGLAALGGALISGGYSTAAVHLLTVGALGTLSTGVMGRVWLVRGKQEPARFRRLAIAAVLVSLAALLRLAAALAPLGRAELLWGAATAWSLALALLLGLFLRVRSR